MPSLLLFRDCDPWSKPGRTGFNKTGYVTDGGVIIYPRYTRIVARPSAKLRTIRSRLIDISKHPSAYNIEMFFLNNNITPNLFQLALNSINDKDSRFWDSPIKLPKLNPDPPTEFEERWKCFTELLLPGDTIATFDTRNFMSRVIAYVDQGTWSHVGLYTADGTILEAGTG